MGSSLQQIIHTLPYKYNRLDKKFFVRTPSSDSPVASLYKPYMNPEIVGTIRFFDDFVLVRCCRYQIQLLPVWQLWGESVNRINPKWPQLKLGQILKQQ